MSLGKAGKKFRKTCKKFGLSLDKLSNAIHIYLVNSFISTKKEYLYENCCNLCKIF